ncbi:NAD(P)H-quinone oxidoreductase [Methylovirgula sp. HY1]|uniref:NAD(P)H-quinone oxidoreductase n=1 Tax=Methylovirgula sp. HY1 TaxID=2822761 RepID=UPI001C5B00DA|nr:NAD(P)H-quinone oxidoreductase [Methylovirgula sp. HY1]QXX74802.1 Phthiocerol/phenolphthiocerol synthesis polyketide synthase type I PpsC [Methylovirgula sp. HY1]
MVALPAMMRQVYFDGTGAPDVIRIGEAPVPQPGPGKVLVEVVAAGINRPDCIQRSGNYPPPAGESNIPGLEISGRVVALGEGVTTLREGDAVCALLGSGGYADYALAEAPLCLPVPRPLSLVEAGGLPETFFTVYDNVFTRGRLRPGETFLVHGGSSGIGSTAIQLAKLFGATVITTAGSPEKCAFCKTLGADLAIDYKTEDFVEAVKKFTQKKGVDVILDMVGGAYMQKNLSILAVEGRLVQIAFLQSSIVENFNFMLVMLKRLTLTGSTLRSRSLAQKAEVAEALRAKVWPLLDDGKAKPIIHATFPLEDARTAHEMMESSSHAGKILLLTGK